MPVTATNWDRLARQLHGQLFLPADALYGQARRVFNARIDARPAAVAYCLDVEDVVACVAFCAGEGIGATCRCGAHGALGYAAQTDELLIDLTAIQSVRLDLREETISVGGGARWGQVDLTTYPRGYASPGGGCPTVGVGGLTLGGGFGPLARSRGLTIDNLIEAEVVTARYGRVTVNETSEPDLFWALRGGGGGNFGAVTRFKFRTFPIEPVLTAGSVMFAWGADTKKMLQFYREWMRSGTADNRLTLLPIMGFDPGGNPLSLLSVFFNGPWAEGYAMVMKLLADAGIPASPESPLGPTTLPSFTAGESSTAWPGVAQIWKSGYLQNDFPDDAIDMIMTWMESAPKPLNLKTRDPGPQPRAPDLTFCFIESLGGEIARTRPQDTAFFWRDNLFSFTFIGIYPPEDAELAQRMEQWTTGFRNAMQPYYSGGVYVNYLQEGLGDWRQAYYGDNRDRLRQVKQACDPDRVFRFPQDLLAPGP